MSNPIKLFISLLLPQLVGGLGAFFTLSSVQTWYLTLSKPSWNPPSWLFGPVWTSLYVLMGIACFLVWKSNHPQKNKVLLLYAIQLFLNFLWSPAFFGAQNPLLGLVVIFPLLASILACIVKFRQIHKWAAILMVPYILWVSFATALNAAIWFLNS